MSRLSLRARLVVLVLGTSLVGWLLIGVGIYRDVSVESEELLDAQLAQSAELLIVQAAHDFDEIAKTAKKYNDDESDNDASDDEAEDDEEEERKKEWREEMEEDFESDYESPVEFLIAKSSGEVLYRSSPDLPATAVSSGLGFSTFTADGARWRVYRLQDTRRNLTVAAAQATQGRKAFVERLSTRIIMPALWMLPVLGLLLWLAIGRGLAPLRQLRREIGSRRPTELEALRLELPRDLEPLQDAINRLLADLELALAAEKRFTSDAAHELRTPLAALKTQAQVALREPDEAARSHALSQLLRGIDRTTRLVEQLLTLARLEEAGRRPREVVSLDRCVRAVLQDLGPRAAEREIELALEANDVQVEGSEGLLEILIRNLADNAIRYAPAGGRVTVRVAETEGKARLEVNDNGAGVRPEEEARIFDRFYRGLGTEEPGSGLGLSIVRRIAELHEASIEFERVEGFTIRLRF